MTWRYSNGYDRHHYDRYCRCITEQDQPYQLLSLDLLLYATIEAVAFTFTRTSIVANGVQEAA
jgi:hypothetical protein